MDETIQDKSFFKPQFNIHQHIRKFNMARTREEGLTARESQIMKIIWDNDKASVEDIQAKLPDRLVDSTIRTMLQIMEDKGYVTFHKQSRAKIYRAIIEREEIQSSAIQQMIDRLFGGSAEMLLARMIESELVDLEGLDRLRKKLRQ
jgi:BlaI family transcriptional regulator, penicillinase repressor